MSPQQLPHFASFVNPTPNHSNQIIYNPLQYFRTTSPADFITQHSTKRSSITITTVICVILGLIIISFNYWQLQQPKSSTIRLTDPAKSESAVILIAGSVAMNGSELSTRKISPNKQVRIKSDLQGTITDVANMYKLFIQSKGNAHSVHIHLYIYT